MDRTVAAEDVSKCVFLDLEALACVAGCLTRQSQGRAGPPARLRLELPAASGPLEAHGALVDGLYSLGLRVGGPGASQLLLLDPETGALQAVLLDQGRLAMMGQALAGAVASRHLAPEGVRTVGVLGADARVAPHLEALALVQPLEAILVDGDPAGLTGLPEALAAMVRPEADRERLAAASQLLLAVSGTPVAPLAGACLRPGHLVLTAGDAWRLVAEHLEVFDQVVAAVAATSPLRGRTRAGIREIGRLQAATGAPRGRALCHLTEAPVLDTALGFLAWRKSQKYRLGTVHAP